MALSQIAVGVSSLFDLFDSLNTFLGTGGAGNPGWTIDVAANAGTGEWALSKDDPVSGEPCEVAFQWDPGSPNNVGIYQYHSGSGAGNYNGSNDPYNQADDSGNGEQTTTDGNFPDSRFVSIGSTPLRYWCFAGAAHVYVVVETASGEFRHFGFGVLDKTNDWDGGSFAYGQRQNQSGTSSLATRTSSTALLDGLAADDVGAGGSTDMELFVATVRCENLPAQPAGGMWAVFMGDQAAANLGQDRQGSPVDRVHFTGGFRANLVASAFGQFQGSLVTGLTPGYPLAAFYWDRDSSPSQFYGPMGFMPDVRGINIANFAAGQEIVIGSDSWYAFPTFRRGEEAGDGTLLQGILYKANP